MAKKKYEWEENTDYQALINQNVKAGDFASAALNEAKRNQKISDMDAAGTNKWGATATSRYSQFLPVDNKVDGNPEEFRFETPAPTWENPYDEKESELMDSILDKGPFSYDPMSDPLYQQYASTYGREGDRAMRNTLAEVASGAGGMNSYALAAAQQAQNYYGAQLADKVPELYQMAYDMYLKDIDNEAMKLGLVQNAGQTAYNRYLDEMGIWKDNRDFAYGADRDQRQDALAEREWQYGMTGDIRENARAEVDAIIAAGGTPSQQLLDEAGYSAEYIAAMQGLYAPQTPIYGGGGGNDPGNAGTDETELKSPRAQEIYDALMSGAKTPQQVGYLIQSALNNNRMSQDEAEIIMAAAGF